MKRCISVFLSLCLVLTMLATGIVTASAEGTPIDDTSVTWSFNEETGVLYFDGEGVIPDYDDYKNDLNETELLYPWKDVAYTSIVFGEGITGIGNYAFCYSPSLESVEIPDNVTVLGKGIFFNCAKLETVKLPSEVTQISESMFSMCSALKDVTFGVKTEAIAKDAFYRCDALEAITLPDSLKVIGDSAFYQCTALKSLTVPEGVTTIGERVFYCCEALEEVVLPSTLEAIGESTFDGCRVLKSIALPDKLTVIPADLCSGCRALTSVTLPKELTVIEAGAFSLCDSLTAITVPATVNVIAEKSIGYGKYSRPVEGFTITGYANTVARLYADANEFTFVSLGYVLNGKCGETVTWEYNEEEKTLYIKGDGAMEDFSDDALALYNLIDYENVVIDETITRIGAYAFYNAAAMDFALSENVTEIGEKAIGYYIDEEGNEAVLEGVSITGYDETAAHTYATENNVTFNSLGKLIATEGKCGDDATWTYDKDTKTLTVSGTGAIYDYTAEELSEFADYEIEKIIIEDGITAIGDFAFCTTNSYDKITIGKDVMSIGDTAFGYVIGVMTDDEGNPTDKLLIVQNADLNITGYIVTPVDEFVKEHKFKFFTALDTSEYPVFEFSVPTVTDHINGFIFMYEKNPDHELIMSNFNYSEFGDAIADLPIATGANFEITNSYGTYNYKFIVPGDINGDGKTNSTDALAILRHSVQVETLEDDCQLKASDINHDGSINSTDALIILQLAVEKAQITDYYNPGEIR